MSTKRPRDLNQIAKSIKDEATGAVPIIELRSPQFKPLVIKPQTPKSTEAAKPAR